MATRETYSEDSNVTSHLATVDPASLASLVNVITEKMWDELERDASRNGHGALLNSLSDDAVAEDELTWTRLNAALHEVISQAVTTAKSHLA